MVNCMVDFFSIKLQEEMLRDLFFKYKINLNIDRRKMFLKNAKINPHFDYETFGTLNSINLIYLSYVEDEDVTDCMDYGFNNVDFAVRKRLYDGFTEIKGTASAVFREQKKEKGSNVYSEEYHTLPVNKLNSENEKQMFGIVSSDNFEIDKRFIETDIKYISEIVFNKNAVMIKVPIYAGYNYMFFCNDSLLDNISVLCTELWRKK